MALMSAFGYLGVICAVLCIGIAFGTRLLEWLRLDAEGALEQSLYAAGLFFALLQVATMILTLFGWLHRGTCLLYTSDAADE